MPVPYNKKNMQGLQKGFGYDKPLEEDDLGPTNEEMVEELKKKKDELAKKVSGWFNSAKKPD